MEEKIAEAAEIDVNSEKCAGVYDKKLMWRAFAYMDETVMEDGSDSGNLYWNN